MMPKAPKVRDIAVPNRSSSEVQQAADEARRQANGDNVTNNWLTGGSGVSKNNSMYAAARMLTGG